MHTADPILKAAHNAARILSNLSSSHLSKADREECMKAAQEIYRIFGEPAEPITSTGGNYFDGTGEVEMVRLLTRARVYARGEFRNEIDACLNKIKELNHE